ncbi:type VII secretion-associated serine protease mycosin [Streptomyces sp. NPDC020403]|uniref:type VII secretion-associated serine protease mycosin n=1 Tax=unclassified Streptomyces TaxID=2593676 RepID=UPI0033FD3B4E
MPASSTRVTCRRVIYPALLVGVVLAGSLPATAHADSVRSNQWHLTVMKAEEMWETSTGKGVTVAVIDSGVDTSNADLQGQILEGKDFATNESGDEHTDIGGHGTGMAALIAGTGDSGGGDGAFGLAPGVKILPIRVPDKAANLEADIQQFNTKVPAAIRYAADNGAKVINISLVTSQGSQQLTDAVAYALDKGSLIFAGVGNDAERANGVKYPAATPGAVGVGAVSKDLRKTGESQWGPQVDLSAPGEEMIYACTEKSGLCKGHGTSAATALVSASAALIWSKYPEWTNNQVLRVLLNTAGGAVNGEERTDYIGYGIVRPRIALKSPGDPGPADVYPLPDLAAAVSPAPSAESSRAVDGAEASGESEEPNAGPVAADDESGNAGLWIGLGVGAAVLAGGVAAVAMLRSRRRKAAAPAAAPYQPSYVGGQSQPTYPPYAPPPTSPSTGSGSTRPYGGPPNQAGGSAG